jgi:DNA repair exonuclease SbcCD ATPase subunit
MDSRMSERAAGAASTEERATRGPALTGPHVGTSVRERPRAPLLSGDDEQTLLHAGRVLEQLRAHLAELDRREQSLNSQLTIFDQEQRALRLQAWQSQEETREREAALISREAAVQERETACAGQSDAVAMERAELRSRQSELDAERERLQADIERQVADAKHTLEEQRTTLAREWAALAEQSAAWETQRERELVAHREQLDALRAAALTDIERQLAQERGSLDAQREALERERTAIARDSLDWEARRGRELTAHQEQLETLRREKLTASWRHGNASWNCNGSSKECGPSRSKAQSVCASCTCGGSGTCWSGARSR